MKYKIFLFLIGIIILLNFVSALYNESRCEYLYFWILDNNYVWTNISLENGGIDISEIYSYPSLCGKELPQPSLKKLIFYESQPSECNYQEGFWKQNIPFFEIELGEKNCSELESLSYFFDIEEKSTGDYSMRGINAFLTITLISAVVLGGIWAFNRKGGEDGSD